MALLDKTLGTLAYRKDLYDWLKSHEIKFFDEFTHKDYKPSSCVYSHSHAESTMQKSECIVAQFHWDVEKWLCRTAPKRILKNIYPWGLQGNNIK